MMPDDYINDMRDELSRETEFRFLLKDNFVESQNYTSEQLAQGLKNYEHKKIEYVYCSQFDFASGMSLVDKNLWCFLYRDKKIMKTIVVSEEFLKYANGFDLAVKELLEAVKRIKFLRRQTQ